MPEAYPFLDPDMNTWTGRISAREIARPTSRS